MNRLYFRIFMLCIHLFLLAEPLFSQRVQFFEPTSLEATPSGNLQLIGYLSDHYIAFRQVNNRYPELININQNGSTGDPVILKFIDSSWINRVDILIQGNVLMYILQGHNNGKHYLMTARSNEKGELLEPINHLDTTDYQAYRSMAYYRVLQSPDKNHTVMYRFVSGFSSSLLLFNAFRTDRNGISKGEILTYVPINQEMEMPGHVFVNNNGQLFFTVFDKPRNFKLGTELQIFQSGKDNSFLRVLTIYLKENKPVDLLMSWSDSKNQLVLGGLYYNFYSRHIEGAIYVFVDPVRQKCDTIVYQKMDHSFKKQLRDKIYNLSLSEIIDNMQCRYFSLNKYGAPILVADMFNNSDIAVTSRKMPLPASDPNLPTGKFQQGNPNTAPNTFRQETNNQIPNYIPSSNNVSSSSRLQNQGRSNNAGYKYNPPSPINFIQAIDEKNRLLSRSGLPDFRNGWPLPGTPEFRTYNDDIISVNKRMDFKTLLFGLDDSMTGIPPKWVRSLYVPQTFYSVAVLVPGEENIGLISYEIESRNQPFLIYQSLSTKGKAAKKVLLDDQQPVLFEFGRSVFKSARCMATFYRDPSKGRLGLAEISW